MTIRKRKSIAEPDHHDRWLVSYADFITLLFAFFVVMYSISAVNNQKYKTLSESIDQAFHEKTAKPASASINPIEIGPPQTDIKPVILEHPTVEEMRKRQELSDEIMLERRHLIDVSEELADILEPYIDKNLVTVNRHDFWIELEMNSELLFSSGEAELSSKAIPVLENVARTIQSIPNVVHVEGHTDNVPIDTVEYPSNWELSSARATSVVRELIKQQIDPARLSAVGYGEFHPIADNNSETGRFKNRRVLLVLMSQVFARYGMNDEERAKALNIHRE